ncbi:MAG: Holliday junction branch migration protein RuvA, partial [Bacteroidota bacterium]
LHLINVNSVGPRTALTILSSLSPRELEQVIANGQTQVLKTIKGIGDKAAQRIVLELQGKLRPELLASSDAMVASSGTQSVDQEALAALTKLGIGKPTAEKAVARVRKGHTGELSLEALIKQALQAS